MKKSFEKMFQIKVSLNSGYKASMSENQNNLFYPAWNKQAKPVKVAGYTVYPMSSLNKVGFSKARLEELNKAKNKEAVLLGKISTTQALYAVCMDEATAKKFYDLEEARKQAEDLEKHIHSMIPDSLIKQSLAAQKKVKALSKTVETI